jgi:amino acid adenylation domain-containing protein
VAAEIADDAATLPGSACIDTLLDDSGRHCSIWEGKAMTAATDYDVPVSDDDYRFPASYAQRRLWFLDQLAPGSAAYNIAATLRMRGMLQVAALRRALEELTARHESLRTTFAAPDGDPVQVVAGLVPAALVLVDREDLPEGEWARWAAAEAAAPFDLARGPLLRARLLRLDEREHILLLTVHHIVSDEWSMGVLLGELGALYSAFAQGLPSPLAELPVQYADYAEWQRGWLAGAELEGQVAYWRQVLAGAPEELGLPTDRPRPREQSYRGAVHRFVLPETVGSGLGRLARAAGATPFMVLLAGFQVLLSRYSGQEDLVVGTPIAGRTRSELEGLIGFFVNTLALRADLAGDPSFRVLLGRVREAMLGAYAHQDLPFERLVEELAPRRDPSRNPIFQTMFVLHNTPTTEQEFHGLDVESEVDDSPAAKFDLTLYMMEAGQGMFGTFAYSTDLFDASTIERMAGHYATLLESAVTAPDRPLSQLEILTEPERGQLLKWNQTETDYPRDRCVHQLFEAQVDRTPDAVALTFEDHRLNYLELDQRANRLAQRLREMGVRRETRVGVCMERSPGMVVGLLAVLKAGGAYVPLDPANPPEHLTFMFQDAQVAVLLTQQRLRALFADQGIPIICLDTEWESIAQHSPGRVESDVTLDDPMYVIYTSGSTGRPKGVVGLHRGAVNRFHWMWSTVPFAPGEICCQKTALSFVDSVWEIFGPLLQGIETVAIPDQAIKDPQAFVRVLAETGVTRIVLVPSLLRVLLESYPDLRRRLPALRFWVSSGETLPLELCALFRERMPHATLLNLYGSSEVSADVTWHDATAGRPAEHTIPIGRPIANTQIYILDRYLHSVPVGVPGEIYVGGAGLARGYLNRPELTAGSFITDPFTVEEGKRLYRTGDLGRYQPNGAIEYLGRRDHQVKLRGFRIELGEIEVALNGHPVVRESVVVLREDIQGDARLVAYVVPAPTLGVAPAELRAYLRERLPAHMIPAAFVILEALPLTPSGKVDRKALPVPDQAGLAAQGAYVPPGTPEEQKLAEIWVDILGLERAGIDQDFFELGGHSLAATRVISRIRDSFQVELPLRRLFETPTIAALGAAIAEMKANGGAPGPALSPIPRAARRHSPSHPLAQE